MKVTIMPILWQPENILKTITDVEPRLASWDKSTLPSQGQLREYLDKLISDVLPLPSENLPLFLHLDIDVKKSVNLLKHHDLENYLTPLFGVKRLNPARFVLVSARKYVGDGSRLLLGSAYAVSDDTALNGWHHFAHTTHGSAQSKQWKENLRNAFAKTNPQPLITRAVEVQLAWQCSPQRNWVALWKPTGDCMGPLLGETNSQRQFAPNDDRIVMSTFHRSINPTIGHNVHIDMWWRSVP
jgi:hypothetical protein